MSRGIFTEILEGSRVSAFRSESKKRPLKIRISSYAQEEGGLKIHRDTSSMTFTIAEARMLLAVLEEHFDSYDNREELREEERDLRELEANL